MATTLQAGVDYRTDELDGLIAPNADRGLRDYVRRLWAMRHYMLADARGSVSSSTTDFVLGRAWLILEPILTVSVYFVLFGLAIRGGDRIPGYDFLSYLVIGRGVFTLLSRAVSQSASSINKHASNSAFDFPQASYPLGKVLSSTLRYRYELAATLMVVLVRGQGFRWQWLLVPAMGALLIAMSAGFGLLAARSATKVPDVRNVIQTVLRLLYYASGVMIPVETFIPSEGWLKIFTLFNPTFALVKIHHWAWLGYDQVPLTTAFVSVLLWTGVIAPLGLWWFFRGERSYQAAVVSSPSRRRGRRSA